MCVRQILLVAIKWLENKQLCRNHLALRMVPRHYRGLTRAVGSSGFLHYSGKACTLRKRQGHFSFSI